MIIGYFYEVVLPAEATQRRITCESGYEYLIYRELEIQAVAISLNLPTLRKQVKQWKKLQPQQLNIYPTFRSSIFRKHADNATAAATCTPKTIGECNRCSNLYSENKRTV